MVVVSSAAAEKPMVAHLDGVLLLDKPVGPSSTKVLGHVKHLLGAKKAGHGGTLDPMASGLLPILFGEATKYAAQGLDADKTYLAEIALGAKTDTADREGEVIAQAAVPALDSEHVASVLSGFRGARDQLPPMYSAIKKDGRALYDYARAGQTVDRSPRPIVIHEIALIELNSPLISIRVTCSKGTYIRTLAEEIGQALGCPAHLHALRRIGVGNLQPEEVVPLEWIERAAPQERSQFLKPVDWLIRDWPAVTLKPGQADQFGHGQAIRVAHPEVQSAVLPGAADQSLQVRVKDPSGVFLGTGRLDRQGFLHPQRVRTLNA